MFSAAKLVFKNKTIPQIKETILNYISTLNLPIDNNSPYFNTIVTSRFNINQLLSFWNKNDNDSLVTEDANWLLIFHFAYPNYFKINFISYVENNYEVYYQNGIWSKLKRIISSNSDDNNNELININGDLIINEMNNNTVYSMNISRSSIRQLEDNHRFHIFGGSAWNNGAYIALKGKDDIESGRFTISANNGESFCALEGRPDGTLIWNNNSLSDISVKQKSILGNGYISFNCGLKIQWGSALTDNNGISRVTFPIQFVNEPKILAIHCGSATDVNTVINNIAMSYCDILSSYKQVNIVFAWFAIGS